MASAIIAINGNNLAIQNWQQLSASTVFRKWQKLGFPNLATIEQIKNMPQVEIMWVSKTGNYQAQQQYSTSGNNVN